MNPEAKRLLERKRQQLAEQGTELTPDQLLGTYHLINDLCQAKGSNIIAFQRSLAHVNLKPPRPPYHFTFESQEEAQDFANRAKSAYNVDCDINPLDHRKWELTNK